jgi:hypothetical protein
MLDGRRRITQDVDDISSADELIRYAAAAQLTALTRRHPHISQNKIAHAAGLAAKPRDAAANLSTALRTKLTPLVLQRLDEVIGALGPDLEYTGGLSSLALRLRGEQRGRMQGNLIAHVPPSWTGHLLEEPVPYELGTLFQASGLLSAFFTADRVDTSGRSVADVRERYRNQLEQLMDRLIVIGVAPPTPRNIDAQVMLGSLASYAFEPMQERLEHELRTAPLGFQVWRAITTLVKLSPETGHHADALKAWIRRLLRDAEQLRYYSLHPGRSLDIELAISVPGTWSGPEDDWVVDVLLNRARNRGATVRERGTAAMGLWERAFREERPDLGKTEADLDALIAEFMDPEARPDAANGLQWLALTLQQVIRDKIAVCNEWPDAGKPWIHHVEAAANDLDHLGIPEHLLTGTKNLFRHMILQNVGVYRRHAIETVITGGWNEPVARALGRMLEYEEEEAWVRIRALFALGYLRNRDRQVEADLTRACKHAYRNLTQTEPTRGQITEMHAALFAVGDCFGAAGAEERARSVREGLRGMLTDLVSKTLAEERRFRRVARAAAYLLTVTAQPRLDGKKDLSEELLETLCAHRDPVTSRLSIWALSFRFRPDGTVRPLLAAAQYARRLDSPPYMEE